ncbi:hypothetical protein [Limimaricola cinnabarinus]|uniref:hypothetical protein n=1 Tax=Limimaricola cinnabarinus TaxID=1125964 RepID=UPI0005ECA4B0|nr:hypothetical protein [Limimaricola cinnabarinus]
MTNTLVAFGLAAMTAAFKAKQRPLTEGEITAFTARADELVPDDALAQQAVAAFLTDLPIDYVGAGQALLDFTCVWSRIPTPEEVQRTEALLTEDLPSGFDAWQREADHD